MGPGTDMQLPEMTDSEMEGKIVFPYNVYEYVTTSNGLKPGDKKNIIFTGWVFVSAILFWLLLNLTRTVTNHYVLVSLVIMLAVEALVGGLVLSYVFDLDSLGREMDQDEQSFAQYFSAAKPLKADKKVNQPFDMYEFKDGSVAVYIQMAMGYNTTQLSQAGCALAAEISRTLNKSRLHYRTLVTVEDFRNSVAAQSLMDSVKQVDDSRLFKQYRNIIQHVIDIAATESNVPVTVYAIYAKNRLQRDALIPAVNRILHMAAEEETCFRETRTLTCEEIVTLYQGYTKIKVLDMGLVRAQAVDQKAQSSRLSVLKIYGDKAVYSTSEFTTLQETILKEHGLTEIKS